jgi:hypothetical protein
MRPRFSMFCRWTGEFARGGRNRGREGAGGGEGGEHNVEAERCAHGGQVTRKQLYNSSGCQHMMPLGEGMQCLIVKFCWIH